MPLFTLECRDRADSLALRLATRADHLAYVEAHRDMVKLAGPWLDDQGQPTGSLFILEAADAEAVRVFAAADPYARAGLFATVQVTPWRLVVGGFAG